MEKVSLDQNYVLKETTLNFWLNNSKVKEALSELKKNRALFSKEHIPIIKRFSTF